MAPYNFHTFSTMLLNDLLSQYDFLNPKLIYIGCILMVSIIDYEQKNYNYFINLILILGCLRLCLSNKFI